MPLKQLTKLVINDFSRCFLKIMDLLYCVPNVHTFGFNSYKTLFEGDVLLLEQSEILQLVSNNNRIKELNINCFCEVDHIQYLVKLCSRLEHITLKTTRNTFEPILRFLLLKDHENIHDLNSALIEGSHELNNLIDSLLTSKNLLNASLRIRSTSSFTKMYLWW